MKTLAQELEHLERTDPAVKAAAENLERVKREIVALGFSQAFIEAIFSVPCHPCQRDAGKPCIAGHFEKGRMVCFGRIQNAAEKFKGAGPREPANMTEVVPVTWKQTVQGVYAWHRHLSRGLTGNRFGAGLAINGEVVAVACAGTPARVWNELRRIGITRVAVRPGVDVRENACSRLYGALCGAAQRLGYLEAWTYTLPEEPGTSLRAANFEDMGLTDGGEWDRPSRPRGPAERSEPKRRWRRMLAGPREPTKEGM